MGSGLKILASDSGLNPDLIGSQRVYPYTPPPPGTFPVFPGLSTPETVSAGIPGVYLGGTVPNPLLRGLDFKRLQNEERLRFLREQLRKGRLATVVSTGGGSPGQGFQLGKKSLLGGTGGE